MEVKPGYKQTEVGVIPEEWEVKTLGSLTTLLTNGFVGTATTAYVEGDDGVLYIQGYNVQENGFNFHGIKRVSKAFHARNKKSCLQAGDLLTIQTGDIGVTTVIPPELVGANCHALIISRLRKQESEPGYYCQYFNSERGRVAFKEIETGTTMKHLNGGDMKRLFLPSPPVEEQRAIATALSDVDGLLGGLDRLIAKKRDLKQAAMQQLLTGQTRLPGFHSEWEVKRLGDVFTISAGKSKSAFIAENGDFWICDMGSVSTEGRLIVSKRTNHRCDFLRKGDLIMPKDDIGGGNIIGKVGYIDGNETYILGDHVYCLRALEGDPRFLAFTINSHRVNSELRKKVIGSAQLGLGRKSVTEQEIQIPPTPEQTAIAEVLTDMDAELAAMEQRREKTRALKQAMMQELLTGRTRLV